MTFKQTTFLITWVAIRVLSITYDAAKTAVLFVNDVATALFDLMLHISIYQAKVSVVMFDLEDHHEADGVLWVRRENNGAIMTPLPFRLPNRWVVRRNAQLTRWLDMEIRSIAILNSLQPHRIVWKPSSREMAGWIKTSAEAVELHNQRTLELDWK